MVPLGGTPRRSTRYLLSVAVLLAGVSLFASCGGEGSSAVAGPTPPGGSTPGGGTTPATPTGSEAGSVTAIALSSSAMSLTIGDSGRLVASLTTTGTPPTGGWAVAWQSTNPSIVSVTSDGSVKALAEGSSAVTATADGKTATAVITVGPQPWVNSVAVVPASTVMIVGDTLAMSAVLGTVGTPPAGGWPVTWLSNQTSVATVSSTGVVKAVAPGGTTIFASSGVAAGTSSVRVVTGPTVLGITLSPSTLYVGVGSTGSFARTLTTVGAAPAGGWPVTWTSASTAIATVDAAGVVTGVTAGTTTITATSGTQTATATVVVGASTSVTSVSISESFMPQMVAGGTQTAAATVGASGPPPANGWVVTWTSSNTSVLTVAGNGGTGSVLTGVAPGTATLTASVGGKSASQSVTVLSPPGVLGVRINAQDPYDLALGDAVTLDAQVSVLASPPGGNVVVTWASSNPAVATVDASGTVRGVALGTTVITATAYGVSASINLNVVTPPPVTPPPPVSGITSVSITPQVAILNPGARGWTMANVVATTSRPTQGGLGWPVQWTSSNPAVVAIPSVLAEATNYDAVGEGTATITASLGGQTATSTVYVATARTLSVTPTSSTLSVGQQLTLVPTVTSTGPLPASGYPVAYSSSSPLVATVSATGVVTALGVGKTGIRVTAGVLTTVIPVTVTGSGLTMSIATSVSAPGIVTQSPQGYSVKCDFGWSASPTGTGVARWGKADVSFDGVTFYYSGYNGFRVQTVAAGQTDVGMGGSYSGPVTATAAPWTLTMRFRYAENASDIDVMSGFAPLITVDRTFVCAP